MDTVIATVVQPDNGNDDEEYIELVLAARAVIATSMWTLGDLAAQVGKVYGEDRLGQFAKDVGVNPATMRRVRSVAMAFPDTTGLRSLVSFSVAKVLAGHPARLAIAQANPGITVTEARELVGRKQRKSAAASRKSESQVRTSIECPACHGTGKIRREYGAGSEY